MPLLISLWLALLHALVAAPAVRVPASLVVRATYAEASVLAGRIVDRSPRTSPAAALHESVQRPAHDALRVAHPPAGLVATSGAARVAHVGPAGTLDAAPRVSGEAAYAADARARQLDASHAAATRGAVLPYFATAPPLQS
jgi:hypothetical protein